jgi:hypothetical protein
MMAMYMLLGAYIQSSIYFEARDFTDSVVESVVFLI